MEYVNDAYKEAMKANVRGKSYVWVSLDLVNTYAQESAYISSAFTGSELGLYDDSIAVNSVTSTENDGSITFTFGEYTKLLLNGVRFILNDTVDSVTATNGTQSKTVTVEDDEVVVEQEFKNCHYIKITPNSGSLSIKKIYFGTIMNFDHDVIMNTSRRNQIMRLNEELPIKEFSFTVHNYDRLWNKDNPDSYAKYICEKQKIIYRYGRTLLDGTISEIVGGVVYLREFSSDDYKATFSGVGLLDYLEDNYSKGTIYPDGITLYQLAEMVMIDAGISNYELDACLRTFKVTNPLPIDTHKACLQLIAHAGRCVLFEDRNGAVCLKSVDRPVIYKTGYVINATNFSKGEDVVNPLTVANYASTEPSYTYADGLHYFFPEVEDDIDESTNYIPLTYANPCVIESYIGRPDVVHNFTGNVCTVNGVTFTINNDGSVTVTGQNTKRLYSLRCWLFKEQHINIPNNDYVYGAANDIHDSAGFYDSSNRIECNLLYERDNIADEQLLCVSRAELDKRKITDKTNIKLYGLVIANDWLSGDSAQLNYTFYPKLYKFNKVTPSETLPVGFVSEDYANSNGRFVNTPEIQIVFTSPCRLTELVMNCAVAPKDFTIKCYLNDRQVAIRTITDNTNTQIDEIFSNLTCDKFTVTFTRTLAGQRIHVNSVEPVAAVDYEITYKDLTSNPIANEIEKVSRLECELYKFADPRNSKTPTGNFSIQYNEIEGGGLSADITSGIGTLALIPVTQGVNTLEIGSASIIDNVYYADDKEGGTVEIIEKGAYYVKVNCSRDGDVTVSGTEFIQTVTDYNITVNEIGNPVRVSNPLISTEEHYNRLKDWFLDYYENDIEYRFDYRGDPVIDADDQIFLENKFVTDNLVRIESEELSTSAGMDTNNQIVARRMRYNIASKTVLRDFVLNHELLYLDDGQYTTLEVIEWIPDTVPNKTITWSSSDSSIVTVDTNGKLLPLTEGEATITATSSNGITHTCRVISTASTVPVTDFTMSNSAISLGVGSSQQLYVASWEPAEASLKTVTWTSSDYTVASVDSLGKVTANSEGNAVITATCPDGISKTCSVTASIIAATDFTLSASIASLKIGETMQLRVVSWTPYNTTNKTITWSSSDATTATVSSDGLVKALKDGSVTITATSSNGISKTCALTVAHIEVTDFMLSKNTLSLQVDDTAQLSVISWTPSNAKFKTVTWTTSDSTKATVSNSGLVTAIANGNVTITATCPDGISKTCELTVADVAVTDFTLSSSSETIEMGETVQLSVVSWIPSNAANKTVTWTSSDTSIATVSENGLVTAIADGNATITATCPDGVSKTCAIVVPYVAVTNFSLSASAATLEAGDTLQLYVLTWTPADATHKAVVWSSSDTSKVTISNTGLVTAVADGSATITATADGVSKTCSITVAYIAVTDFTLSDNTTSLNVGDTKQLSVTSWTPSNATNKTVTWTSSDTSIATVSNVGLVTAISNGNATITATCPDGVSKTCAITSANVVVTDFELNETVAAIDVGDGIQLRVNSWTPSNATLKTVTWTSSDTSIATVSESGYVTAISGGNATITATCPDGISKTCTVVAQVDPYNTNYIPFPYQSSEETTVIGNITYTNLGNRLIHMTGRSTGSVYTIWDVDHKFTLAPGKYCFGAFPQNLTQDYVSDTAYVSLGLYNNGTYIKSIKSSDLFSNRTFTITEETQCAVYIVVVQPQNVDHYLLPKLYMVH